MPSATTIGQGRQERVSNYGEAIRAIVTDAKVDAVAFKAVHAGPRYRGTFLIDDGVIGALEEFLPAAPAHNAIYLAGIRAFQEAMPGVPLIAALETEFHATMPERAVRYGVPAEWRQQGVRKYGFHGASHEYVSTRAAEIAGRATPRLISCHLGGSSSMCAIHNGRSVDTTMGFSPQSGLENATRHGDLDVFGVLFMMQRHNWQRDDVYQQLTKTGGLAGLSGVAGGDVRDLEAAAAQGNNDAALALDVFTYEVRKTIGAYAAVMGGLDAIAFTGGIGENSPRLREACCQGLEFLGIQLDPAANVAGPADRAVSSASSQVAVVTLRTNEELVVARRAYAILTK
ncbi:MAG: acetate/propionate family kinase [Acidobacteria bacterium]|nr:acetate/propionate family kinase [Acidobacteriota bacterium]